MNMPLILLDPPGPLFAPYHAAEDALDFARRLHEQQLSLRNARTDFYDPDVHAIVLAFNLRVVARKLDALLVAFRGTARGRECVSDRTMELQAALQHYNAAVAVRDAWDNPVDASVNVLDLAFDCLASIERDVRAFEDRC